MAKNGKKKQFNYLVNNKFISYLEWSVVQISVLWVKQFILGKSAAVFLGNSIIVRVQLL